jgi:hypothetical protein
MTTLTIQPDPTAGLDTFIKKDDANSNNGTSTALWIGSVSTTGVYRTLIKFSLTGIPSGAMITSASLMLYMNEAHSNVSNTCKVYRQKRAWTEAGATWNKYDGENSWGTAGGFGEADCEQTEIGSAAYTSGEAAGWKTMALTAAKIQEMIDGTFTNNGFLLKMVTEDSSYYSHRSSDYTTDTSLRPKLVIEYVLGGQVFLWESD